MPRRSSVALVLIALFVTLGGASVATAQDGPAEVGGPVTFVDPDGIIRGSVTIREVADPFTGHDPSSPPPAGMRYVLLTVTFEAALDQTLDAQPYQVVVQDSEGFLYSSQFVRRPAEDVMPDLQGQLMAPDNRISGVIGYILPEGAVLDRVIYQPASDRFIELADLLPDAGPALGEAVTYTDASGASATITAQLIDPFTKHDPAYPPEAGSRFVILHPVFENVGQLPYVADPYDMALRDTEGYLYTTSTVYRVPGFSVPLLESQTLSPGDRVSGYVGFVVPAEAQLAAVHYGPGSARVVALADLAGGVASGPSEPSPAMEPSPAPSPLASPAPETLPGPGSPDPDASPGTGR